MSETAKASALKGAGGAKVQVMRTQLGCVRGLGAARAGTGHWWAQRITAIALVPLTIWFVYVVLHLAGAPRAEVARFVAHPVNATLLLALIVATFHHGQLGLQVVVEDYIHTEAIRLPVVLLIKAVALLFAFAAAIAVLKLAFSG